VAKDQIPKGATVYVGTDERKKELFQIMSDYWDAVVLDDFVELVKDSNSNNHGIIDQLVTSPSGTNPFWMLVVHPLQAGYITVLHEYEDIILKKTNVESEGYMKWDIVAQ
jgi:hypothetical protein